MLPLHPIRKLSDDELRELIEAISAASLAEDEDTAAVNLFDHTCAHPAKRDLVFWPPKNTELSVDELFRTARFGEGPAWVDGK